MSVPCLASLSDSLQRWNEAHIFSHNSFSSLNLFQISINHQLCRSQAFQICAVWLLTYIDEIADIDTDIDIEGDLV